MSNLTTPTIYVLVTSIETWGSSKKYSTPRPNETSQSRRVAVAVSSPLGPAPSSTRHRTFQLALPMVFPGGRFKLHFRRSFLAIECHWGPLGARDPLLLPIIPYHWSVAFLASQPFLHHQPIPSSWWKACAQPGRLSRLSPNSILISVLFLIGPNCMYSVLQYFSTFSSPEQFTYFTKPFPVHPDLLLSSLTRPSPCQ